MQESADRLLVSVEEAARRLSVGRSLMYELIASGQVRSIKHGRRRLVPPEALVEWKERALAVQAVVDAPKRPAIPNIRRAA